jgi:hypothetical protein
MGRASFDMSATLISTIDSCNRRSTVSTVPQPGEEEKYAKLASTYKIRVGFVAEIKLWSDLFELCKDLVVSGHVSGQDATDHALSNLTERFW